MQPAMPGLFGARYAHLSMGIFVLDGEALEQSGEEVERVLTGSEPSDTPTAFGGTCRRGGK